MAGTIWGASAHTLRTATLALVYPTAKYCCQSWLNSPHCYKIDVQLNSAMRLISGTIKTTPLAWLPVMSNIIPPKIRREAALCSLYKKCDLNKNSLLHDL